MTLLEAIEILQKYLNDPFLSFDQDGREAQKLGIEALKRCKFSDRTNFDGTTNLLPGETRE